MGTADLHTHTDLSDGMMSVEALLEHVEKRTDIDVLAITDHDDVTAGLMAKELVRERGYRFEVIIGEEITTLEGHLIGLFLERTIPRLQRLETSLRAIHEQGGIAIVPHPLSWLTFSLGRRAIRRVTAENRPGVYFDAIETANPTLAARVARTRVLALNQELGLAEVGASDAHFLPAVAVGFTRFPGCTAADLRDALLDHATRAGATELRLSTSGYGQILRQQVRSLVVHPMRSVVRPILHSLQSAGHRPGPLPSGRGEKSPP